MARRSSNRKPTTPGRSAQELAVPGGVSGHIGHDGDVDFYRFRARKGERIIVEVYGRRLGSPIDSIDRRPRRARQSRSRGPSCARSIRPKWRSATIRRRPRESA